MRVKRIYPMRYPDPRFLVPVVAIAAVSGWLAGCGGFARSTSAVAPVAEPTKVADLRPLWDTERVLRNPYKGWYHHYYDNGTRNYQLSSEHDLDQFPGMDHLYIRLSWAHFEPEEDHYNWSWIDDVKDHWTAKGYGISLRISTCETGEAHATPEWVAAAGAKGAMYKAYRREVWSPITATRHTSQSSTGLWVNWPGVTMVSHG